MPTEPVIEIVGMAHVVLTGGFASQDIDTI
jgi:hypothetical protein